MENTELSMDSFVDIVANTVGIVVILTMLTVLRAGQTKNETDINFIKLRALKASVAKKRDELQLRQKSLNKKLSAVGMNKIDFSKPASIKATRNQIKARLSGVRSKLASTQSSYTSATNSLAQLNREEEDLANQQAEAEAAIQMVATQTQGFNVTNLGGSLSSLSDKRDSVVTENQNLEKQIRISKEKFAKLKEDVAKYKKEVSTLSSEKKQLNRLANVTINLDTPTNRDYGRAQIFIECYRPSNQDGSTSAEHLRFISEKTYKRNGDTLTDPAPGESFAELDDEANPSNFRKFAAGATEAKLATRSIHFIVRPDAYAIFIEARNIALASGWKVDWEPLPASSVN